MGSFRSVSVVEFEVELARSELRMRMNSYNVRWV